MIDIKRITKGKQYKQPRVLLYSADGVGKTRWASGAPDPFFIDVNRGSFQYDVQRVVPDTWDEVMEWIHAVERGDVKCKTLVIDSVSDLENIGHAAFFPGTTIDKWDGGYGRGDTYTLTRWRELLSALERVWKSDKSIIFIGHSAVKHFDDPAGPGYDRYELSVRKQLAGLLRQWTDYVFFADLEVARQKVGNETKAVSVGTRWIHTQRSPAFDAKSRGTTMFPEKIPLSWADFAAARAADEERAVALRKEIDTMLAQINDKSLNKQVEEYLRANPDMIVEARNRVAVRFEESQQRKDSEA